MGHIFSQIRRIRTDKFSPVADVVMMGCNSCKSVSYLLIGSGLSGLDYCLENHFLRLRLLRLPVLKHLIQNSLSLYRFLFSNSCFDDTDKFSQLIRRKTDIQTNG